MPTKETIIDNVEHYSARDLFEYIKSGIIGYDELCEATVGYLPADVRKELGKMIEEAEVSNPVPPPPVFTQSESPAAQAASTGDDWDYVDKTNDEELRIFIATHPNHPMAREARRLRNELYKSTHVPHDINTLKTAVADIMTNPTYIDKASAITDKIKEYIDNNYVTTFEFLDLLAQDNNFVSAAVMRNLINDYYVSYPDLLGVGINQKFIDYLFHDQGTKFELQSRPIQGISRVCTEIYFWGIPSSGKTCALGGILSMANNGHVVRNMSQDPDCQGYGYMTRLAEVFKENQAVGTLPAGTSIYDIWEMGFDLEDTEGKIHPITCIDLAGELVRCMYKHDAGQPLTDDERSTLNTVTNLLVSNKSTNRKMHFFVLEYGGENRTYEGLGQAVYLQSALQYIKRTHIFDRETDAIFLLFTKVDKTNLRGRELVDHLIEYTEKHYANFYNGLVSICKSEEINGGRVERLPFTLGNVCFQNYCLFDGRAAENVVKQILNRTKGFKKGKLQKLINQIKK